MICRFIIALSFLLVSDLDELYTVYRSGVDFDVIFPALLVSTQRSPETYSNILRYIQSNLRKTMAGSCGESMTRSKQYGGNHEFLSSRLFGAKPGKIPDAAGRSARWEMGLTYYYPGYLRSGYPKFDYKLFADRPYGMVRARQQPMALPNSTITLKCRELTCGGTLNTQFIPPFHHLYSGWTTISQIFPNCSQKLYVQDIDDSCVIHSDGLCSFPGFIYAPEYSAGLQKGT